MRSELKRIIDYKALSTKDINSTERYEILKKELRNFEENIKDFTHKEYEEVIKYICDKIDY